MCSIISTTSDTKALELLELNQHRGNFSYSMTTLQSNLPTSQVKGFGEFPKEILKDNERMIIHVQAPTGGLIKDHKRIHPVQNINDPRNFLYHNGLLTPKGIKFLQNQPNIKHNETFDTKLLFDAIRLYGWEILSKIEGLFSCVYGRSGEIYMFRSKHGKLFIDNDMNISSERFNNSKCINSDTIYKIDFKNNKLIEIDKFKTLRFNFVVKGEL